MAAVALAPAAGERLLLLAIAPGCAPGGALGAAEAAAAARAAARLAKGGGGGALTARAGGVACRVAHTLVGGVRCLALAPQPGGTAGACAASVSYSSGCGALELAALAKHAATVAVRACEGAQVTPQKVQASYAQIFLAVDARLRGADALPGAAGVVAAMAGRSWAQARRPAVAAKRTAEALAAVNFEVPAGALPKPPARSTYVAAAAPEAGMPEVGAAAPSVMALEDLVGATEGDDDGGFEGGFGDDGWGGGFGDADDDWGDEDAPSGADSGFGGLGSLGADTLGAVGGGGADSGFGDLGDLGDLGGAAGGFGGLANDPFGGGAGDAFDAAGSEPQQSISAGTGGDTFDAGFEAAFGAPSALPDITPQVGDMVAPQSFGRGGGSRAVDLPLAVAGRSLFDEPLSPAGAGVVGAPPTRSLTMRVLPALGGAFIDVLLELPDTKEPTAARLQVPDSCELMQAWPVGARWCGAKGAQRGVTWDPASGGTTPSGRQACAARFVAATGVPPASAAAQLRERTEVTLGGRHRYARA